MRNRIVLGGFIVFKEDVWAENDFVCPHPHTHSSVSRFIPSVILSGCEFAWAFQGMGL